MLEERKHSPLGASGAYRWMVCPGSVGLSESCEKEDSEYALEGTAAHTLGADCLALDTEPWRAVGRKDEETGVPVTKEMADAVSMYVFAVLATHSNGKPSSSNIEYRFHCPAIHKDFFGATDYFAVEGDTLHVWDYKHGAGIIVNVPWNPQLLYYACGVLENEQLWNQIDKIEIHVVQPRAPHSLGPVRSWGISKPDLDDWLWETLVPAMVLTETSDTLISGEHCRFCPIVSKACPQLLKDADEFEELMPKIAELDNTQVSRFLKLTKALKIACKKAEQTAFVRMGNGQVIKGYKLASGKSNRKWRGEAEAELVEEYGERAFKDKELKSPSGIDRLPKGKTFTARHAFKPAVGLVVVEEDDSRAAVNKDTKSLFKPVGKGKKQ
jgi:hypothetical protein